MKNSQRINPYLLILLPLLLTCYLPGFSNVLDVRKFGARGDGLTDDTKSIQAAIDAARLYPNSTIYFPKGIYIIGSYISTSNYLENYCLKIYSNLVFKGVGINSEIKLQNHIFDKKDTTANAHIFYGTHIYNVVFSGIMINMNGSKNLVPPFFIKNNMAIFIDHGYNVKIKNITIKNCAGTNMIAIKGTGHGLLIEKSFFYNGGNYVGGLTPNKYQIDFSFIYSEWDSTRIIKNRIEQQNVDIALRNYSGGIELHGSYSYASDNTIIGCNPGFYISSTWHPLEKTIVKNNQIKHCLRGIAFWINYQINNISIINNNITLTHSRFLNKAFITGIEVPNGNTIEYNFKMANAAPITNLLITGNIIKSLLNDTSKDKSIGLLLHSIQNSRIEKNTIIGMNYGGVVLQGSKWGMKSVVYNKNNFFDFRANNDSNTIAAYIIITDNCRDKNNPGIKNIAFIDNSFVRNKITHPETKYKKEFDNFLGAYITLPEADIKEI